MPAGRHGNIAIAGVVDTGLARLLIFDPAVGLDRLLLTPISRASADQRAGRAGRTQPGVCLRLWSANGQRARPEQTEPEIRRVDLAGAVLQLLALGETDVRRLFWNQWSILGSTMGNDAEFDAIVAELRGGRLLPHVDSSFRLEDAHAAFERLASGAQFGKIVVRIS